MSDDPFDDPDLLPDGTRFARWDDVTVYDREYHVAQHDPAADDGNEGTAARPWKTLGRAAAALRPGERVVVHAGIYRERVAPARGGTAPDRMIAYAAAPGEDVAIRGSEVWEPEPIPAAEWMLFRHAPAGCRIWLGELPPTLFVGQNPFTEPNLSRSGWFPWRERPLAELKRAQLRRGMLFADGRRLEQRHGPHGLFEHDASFWVDERGRFLAVRLPGDAAPGSMALEVAVREQCFAPEAPVDFIRVSGFTIEHAANGVPVPQYGALSAAAGRRWIVEGCTVRHANAVGIDLGHQADVRPVVPGDGRGCHVVRGNTVTDCGITGLCGTAGVSGSLVEGNRFERIGGLDLEHCYEAAAIKFHYLEDALIRGNLIRDCRAACGTWLDWACANNRVTGNRYHAIETVLAAVYVEASAHPDLVDRNVITDIRDHPPNDPPKDGIPGGLGISSDVSEATRIERNLVVGCTHYGIACHRAQKERTLKGKRPSCRGMVVRDNLLARCAGGVLLAHGEGNAADGNLYDDGIDRWRIEDRGEGEAMRFAAWREAGFDAVGATVGLVAEVEETGDITVRLGAADLPEPGRVRGSFTAGEWRRLLAGEAVRLVG